MDRMSGGHREDSPVLKSPADCSESELAAFERMVRLGFDGSDASLPTRMGMADCLAFQYDPPGELVAIAGLKRPGRDYLVEMFATSGCGPSPDEWELELGWVFVTPQHRRNGVATALCLRLLQRVGGRPIFATTRTDNRPMIGILEALGFEQAGKPFPRRGRDYFVFMASGRTWEPGAIS